MEEQRESLEAHRERLRLELEALRIRADKIVAQSRAKRRSDNLRSGLDLALLFIVAPLALAAVVYFLTTSILLALLVVPAAVVIIYRVITRKLRRRPGPGTRAFEAQHNAMLISDVITRRREERFKTEDLEQAARLDREIAYLSKQLEENEAIVTSGDMSPGLGYVGFKAYDGP